MYIGLETDEGLVDDVTINLSDVDLYFKDAVFLNTNLTERLKDVLKKNKILGDYYYTQQYNMGQYDCYTVNLDKLKEFDSKGYSEFEKYNCLEDDYDI